MTIDSFGSLDLDESRLLREVLNGLPDAIYVKNRQGAYVFVNEAAARFIGRQREDILGKTDAECLPQAAAAIRETDENVMRTGKPFSSEERVPTAQRTILFVTDKRPLRSADGDVVGIYGVSRDVTERLRITRELEISEARFRQMVEQAPISVQIFDATGQTIVVNQAFERMWGVGIDGMRQYNILQDPQVAERGILPHIQRAFQGEPAYIPPIPYTPDIGPNQGREIWSYAVVFPVKDEEGRLREVVLLHQDVTELKIAETQLMEQAERLSRSNRDLEQYASIASHDLQEPLRKIASFVDLLEMQWEGRMEEKTRAYLSHITSGVARMQSLIRDLLSYSRLDKADRPFSPVDLNQALALALDDLETARKQAGGTITHDPLPTVPANETQLRQVFQNLIGNALKFRGEAAPAVHVSAREHETEWEVSVRDNGIGIDPRYHDRIFMIFQRLQPAKYRGTGIGLTVCKRIIEKHGGRIRVDTAPGGGAVFTFHLPKHPGETLRTLTG